MADTTVELDFYGKKVPYDGQELGLYQILDYEHGSSVIFPPYGVLDPKHWELMARNKPRKEFVDMLKALEDEAEQQVRGTGIVDPLMQMHDTRAEVLKNYPNLLNTKQFCRQVLDALGGH